MFILILAVIALMLLGVPVAVALGGASLFYIFLTQEVPVLIVIQRMISGVDSFPLLAIPFFILAGNLMNTGGITNKIFAFANSLFGWLRGGLGYVNVVASVIFSGMSGAAIADAGGLGNIEIQAMRNANYDDDFAIGVTAASSIIGPIIPPSLPMIIMGVVGSISIGKLFVAGFIPGLVMALVLCIMVWLIARFRGYEKSFTFSLQTIARSFKDAFLSLLTPVIIVGGILFGIFTPTEAAIAASAYSLFLCACVYRTLNWKNLLDIGLKTAETTASILLIVSAARIFSWLLTTNQVAEHLAETLLTVTSNKIILLLLINLILLIIGCFLDAIATITIMTPVLMPIAMSLGMEPVQFGVMMVLNLMIGLLTPPLGMVLYVLSTVSHIPFEKAVKGTVPFLIPLILVLLLIVFVPGITMWLPGLVYGD